MSRSFRVSIMSSFAAVAMVAVAVAAPRASSGPQAARLATYTSPTGTHHFALSLRPQLRPQAAASHRIVVLFDTSASQTGAYRDDALGALEALLGNLDEKDQVALLAIEPVVRAHEFGLEEHRAALHGQSIHRIRTKLERSFAFSKLRKAQIRVNSRRLGRT